MTPDTTRVSNEPTQAIEASFSTLVMSFAVQASVAIGLTPHPETGKVEKSRQLAQLNIDFLNVIEAKTKGNLTPDEAQLLERLLTELRMRFVQTKWDTTT